MGPAHDNAFGVASERGKCVGRTSTLFPDIPVSDRGETDAAYKGSPVMQWPSHSCNIRKHPDLDATVPVNFTVQRPRESLENPIGMTGRNITALMPLPILRMYPLICCNIYIGNTQQKHLHFDHESILRWYE